MTIASISPHFSIKHVLPVRLQINEDSPLFRLTERIFSPQERHTTSAHENSFTKVLKNRAQRIEGCIRVVSWVIITIDFFKHAFAVIRFARTDLAQGDNRSKLISEAKETFVRLVTLSSMTASLLQWANTVRLLVLDKIVPILQKLIYGANLIVSAFGIEKAVQVLKREEAELARMQELPARDLHKHRYGLALLDLAYHISTIAWAIIGLIELVGSIALCPLLAGSLFMISCGLAFASLVYGLYIEFKIAPRAAPHEQALVGKVA